MAQSWMKFLMVGLSLALYSSSALAQAWQKAEVKRQSRWTLNEWLATRDRMRWSDMWLALNSPSPYEFFFLGAANLTTNTVNDQKFQFKYGIGAYASIVGLEFDHENILGPAYNARFHLRVFGYNVQNTNLTFHVGLRQRDEAQSFRQTYAGVSLTLYLMRFFGVFSQYRYYLASTPGATYGEIKGPRYEAGPFIDFGPLRVFGNYVYEYEYGQMGGYSGVGKGWILGGQLFF